jgi:glucose/arabinose dehydrogenase
MRPLRWIGLGLLLLAACHNTNEQPAPSVPQVLDVRLQPLAAATGLGSVMDLQAPPGDPRIFIAERSGKIHVIDENGVMLATPFLDLSSRILVTGEGGLLSFTFDPAYGQNSGSDFVYVHFTDNIIDPNGDIVVERYTLSADPNVLDPTPTPIIRIGHRQANNHYGGRVMFGPDGMFYISTGDGGGGDNEFGHAQDPNSLLGKLLRIDVSSLTAGNPPYQIPSDPGTGNPVWPNVGRNEVWAIGLRNPFRPAFDFITGFLYIADVGQSQREEVDVVPATLPMLNYGWNIFEGSLCSAGPCDDPALLSSLTMPVYEYRHTEGCAIIGGYVYRGAAIPSIRGTYFFSDLCSGFLRGMAVQVGAIPAIVESPNANAGANVTQSFGRDGAGELYVLTGDGRVLKIVGPPP